MSKIDTRIVVTIKREKRMSVAEMAIMLDSEPREITRALRRIGNSVPGMTYLSEYSLVRYSDPEAPVDGKRLSKERKQQLIGK